MEIKARLNYLRISPRKVRLVADIIRGKSVKEAQAILNFTIKKAAHPILKLLNAAIASAKNDFQKDESNLYIKKIMVNGGPTLKRWMPRARGQANLIRKRTSHIILILEEKGEKEAREKVQKKVKEEKKEVKERKEHAKLAGEADKEKKEKKLIYKIGKKRLPSSRQDIRPKRFFRRKAF